MTSSPFHLGWFISGTDVQGWNRPWGGLVGTDWMGADLYRELGRSLERGRFDLLVLEDNSYVPLAFGGSHDVYLENALSVPRQDPSILAALILNETRHLGVVPTLSTFAYHPYLLARMMGTLDQISGGRAGWNMVTGSSDLAVKNYGQKGLLEHDRRYEVATEFIAVCNALFDSWSPGAIVTSDHVFADPSKVRPIHFEGEWFSSRGPLNSGPLPQGRPVLTQAGGSPRGRAFAAEFADVVVAEKATVEGMKDYRDDIKSRAAAAGRDPDTCKVLFIVSPVVAATTGEARDRRKASADRASADPRVVLAHMSKNMELDLSGVPLDEPLDSWIQGETNATQSSMDDFVRRFHGKTLRQAAVETAEVGAGIALVETPAEVAAEMTRVMAEVGGDGYLIHSDAVTARGVAEIVDGLVPELMATGAVRREYTAGTFRDRLLEF